METTTTHIRISKDHLEKLRDRADQNGRSATKELELLIDSMIIHGETYELASYGEAYEDSSRQATLRPVGWIYR